MLITIEAQYLKGFPNPDKQNAPMLNISAPNETLD